MAIQEGYARVGSRGLTVQKSVSMASKDVFQVWFEFDSAIEEPIAFRVVDELPEEIAVEDVGFHPKHEGDRWSAKPGKLCYADTLEPEATVQTVYAVRGIPEVVADELRQSPTVEVVGIAGEGHGISSEESQ